MFNGEVEHPESPKNELEEESPQKTPSKVISELEDFNPSADTPNDPQASASISMLLFYCLFVAWFRLFTVPYFSVGFRDSYPSIELPPSCKGECNLGRVPKLPRGTLVRVPLPSVVETLSPGCLGRYKPDGGSSIEAYESRKSHGKLADCEQSKLGCS